MHVLFIGGTGLISTSIARQLRRANVILADGTLAEDPRGNTPAWTSALDGALRDVHAVSTRRDVECLRELLNIAWAEHEMTGEYASDVVTFLKSHNTSSHDTGK